MSKIAYFKQHHSNQATLLSVNRPTQPIEQKHKVAEQRIADPSSCLPKGQSYPIPSFFEYRAKPKEYDSL